MVATANALTSGTNFNQNASMSESNGSLTAFAGRDINLKASSSSAENKKLVAQCDVNP